MSAIAKWIIGNFALLTSLYIGLWHNITWLTACSAAFIWIMLASYSMVFFSKPTKSHVDPAPKILGVTVDVAVLYMLIKSDWIYTSLAYLASAVLLNLIYKRSHANHQLTSN